MSDKRKIDRIKRAGKLRRTCHRHRHRLAPKQMAVLDHNNCDFCKQRTLSVVK